jgi:hypothetical protein
MIAIFFLDLVFAALAVLDTLGLVAVTGFALAPFVALVLIAPPLKIARGPQQRPAGKTFTLQ